MGTSPAEINTRRGTPRATRLPLRAPVHYVAPDARPQRAVTVNVSRSGVLIEQATDHVPAGRVTFRLNFASANPEADLPDLMCEGRVVRIEPAPAGIWRVAMTIDSYQSV